MHDTSRTANLLGATALAVSDALLAGTTGAAGTSASGAAALVVLDASPGLSVTELGRRVGLSQSAAARMVDSLEADGLAERRPGLGRWVTVHPTRTGKQAVHRLLAARAAPLTGLIAGLDQQEQARLASLLEKLLTHIYGAVGNNELICRLCDRPSCTADAICPVGEAERASRH
jgi:MarR family transcriptional regulator, negative regulator of the multidrug operon emrRAB